MEKEKFLSSVYLIIRNEKKKFYYKDVKGPNYGLDF